MAEAAIQGAVDQVSIEHWDSPKYGGDKGQYEGQTFTAEVIDRRQSDGQLDVNIADDNGEIDDQLSVMFKVTTLEGSSAPVAAMYVYDGDDVVAVIVRQPNGHLILPGKPGVQVLETRMPNREPGWMLVGR